MSEHIDRLMSRNMSDMRRGSVPFPVGIRHLHETIQAALLEIDEKVKRLEALEQRIVLLVNR